MLLLRKDLELFGGIIQCNGADLQVFPSPMQISMGGDKAYLLVLGKSANLKDIYRIFDTDKKPLNCVTVAEQENYYARWLDSLLGGCL